MKLELEIFDIEEKEPGFEERVLLFGNYTEINRYRTISDVIRLIRITYIGYKQSVTKSGTQYRLEGICSTDNFKPTHWSKIPEII